MTFKQHAYPLLIEPVGSKSLARFIGFFHISSIASVMVAALPFAATVTTLGAIALSFIYCLDRCGRRVSITWDNEGDWRLSFENRAQVSARLCGSSIVNRYFVWLHLRTENRRFISLILPRDSLPANSFRRLRVRLLIDGVGGGREDRF